MSHVGVGAGKFQAEKRSFCGEHSLGVRGTAQRPAWLEWNERARDRHLENVVREIPLRALEAIHKVSAFLRARWEPLKQTGKWQDLT